MLLERGLTVFLYDEAAKSAGWLDEIRHLIHLVDDDHVDLPDIVQQLLDRRPLHRPARKRYALHTDSPPERPLALRTTTVSGASGQMHEAAPGHKTAPLDTTPGSGAKGPGEGRSAAFRHVDLRERPRNGSMV